LSCEETKAVVGGAEAARAVMERRSPLAEIIGIVVRDIREIANLLGGGQMSKRAQL
jgi:hypothetical protein